MGQEATATKTKLNLAEVVRHGEKIILPAKPEPGMTNKEAIATLQRLDEYEEQAVQITEDIEAFPWDGAHAAYKVMEKKFGVVFAEESMGFFGPQPPKMISVPVSPTETILVPWGEFTLPKVEGKIIFRGVNKDGRIIFQLAAVVKRKFEGLVRDLAAATREYLKENSIYRGKAISVQFTKDDGELIPTPMPTFMDLRGVTDESAIFNARLQDHIETSIYTPIERADELAALGIEPRRGAILAGPPGVGKTLLGHIVAKRATKAGLTFIYALKIVDLKHVIKFASFFDSKTVVVYVEDFDRLMSGNRTISTDEILNLTDGIESKGSKLFVIATTNNVDAIQKPMMRPGRIDSYIRFELPDEEATEKLIRHYAKDMTGFSMIPDGEDLKPAAKVLKGLLPAFIHEAVKFSKLAALKLSPKGTRRLVLTGKALLEAADRMKEHIDFVNAQPKVEESDLVKFGNALGQNIAESITSTISSMRDYQADWGLKGTVDQVLEAHGGNGKGRGEQLSLSE